MQQRNWGRFWAPDLILFAGTRTALGMGVGLLMSRRMNSDQRKAAGIALVALGGFTTIPLAMRFAAWRRWRRQARALHAEGACACGCPYCCPAKPEAATKAGGSEAPAA